MIQNNKSLLYACVILTIGLMSVDFISPSLPYIQTSFMTSQETIKNTVVVYMLVLGIGQLFYGFLSDQYGRKPTILTAFVISIIGIGLSACAKNIYIFYLARVITAIGCAGCPVIARSIIADVSKSEIQLKKSFSMFSLTSQLSPGLAPVIGGIIQEYTSWRLSLIVLMLVNIGCFFILYKFMPETRIIEDQLTKIKTSKIINNYIILFKNRYFITMSLLSALIYVYTIGFYNMLPFVLHHINISVVVNGYISGLYACGLAIGAFCLHKYLYKCSSNKLFSKLTILYIIFLATTFIYLKLINSPSVLMIALFGVIMGFMCGIIAPLTLSMSMGVFTKNKGIASSVQSFIKMFFTGVGLILFSYINLDSVIQIVTIFFIFSIIIFIIWISIRGSNRES